MNLPTLPPTGYSISTILVENEPNTKSALKSYLHKYFPNVQITGSASTLPAASKLIEKLKPSIIFFDVLLLNQPELQSLHWIRKNEHETIIVANNNTYAVDAIQCAVSGYLLKPLKEENLRIVVSNTLQRIRDKEEFKRSKKLIEGVVQKKAQEDLIGVPTIEGYEFIAIQNILRCEGLQKCTRVVTKDKTDIVSSYNLGEFRKLLEPYEFFSPHKSYLINLYHLKKYHKEGSIYMVDGGCVPVSKRLKKAFLEKIKRF